MTNQNKRDRDKNYWLIVKKQGGEYCILCGKTRLGLMNEGYKPELVIDNIPNDGDHKTIAKLQLLCHSCNTKKNHPANVEPFLRSATPEMIRGSKYEKDFRRWVAGLFQTNSNSGFTFTFLINSGAEKVNCSPETIKRYLSKMSSDEGIYIWEDRFGSEPVLILKDKYR